MQERYHGVEGALIFKGVAGMWLPVCNFVGRLLLALPLLGGLSFAAEKQSDTALARQYMTGDGVKQDYAKAAALYRRAAEAGDAEGQNGIAVCLLHGFGVKKDQRAGVRFLRLAAAQKNPKACLNLAECFEDGDGVAQDLEEALKWAKAGKAAGAGDADAVIRRIQVKLQPADAGGRVKATGTGFFITADGYLLTCAHVVAGATTVKVVPPPVGRDSRALVARVVKVDAANDLALLKVEGNFEALPLADAAEVKPAQAVFTVGFPNVLEQGVAPKFTEGTISAASGAKDDQRWFQISAPVQPGNSGGPLADEQGNVVGVVNARLKPADAPWHGDTAPQNVNYAVKINIAVKMLTDAGLAGKLPPPPKGKLKLTKAAEKVQAATVLILNVGR